MSNFKLAISLRAIKSQWTLTVNNVASLGIVMVGYRETETLIENFLSDLWFFFFFVKACNKNIDPHCESQGFDFSIKPKVENLTKLFSGKILILG